MRNCSRCKMSKEESEIVKNRNICKICNNDKVKNHYKKSIRYKNDVIQRAYTLVERNVKMISKFKQHYGCRFCNEREPCCLQFHHLHPSEKVFEIHGALKKNVEVYKKEILKCEILCANCHLKVHANKLILENRRELDTSLLILEKKIVA